MDIDNKLIFETKSKDKSSNTTDTQIKHKSIQPFSKLNIFLIEINLELAMLNLKIV